MLSVKEARGKVLSCSVKHKIKKVSLLDSLGLALAENMVSEDFIPAYDNSAMDGFAVKAVDIVGADKNYPIKLKLIKQDLPAGKIPENKLESGYCVQIMTGAPIPEGSDCVVMKEDAIKEGKDVLIFRECKQGENVRYKGEDIKKGDIVIKKGKKIFPGDIGVMASIGRSEILVNFPPTVGILATGSELVEIHEKLETGKVRDSNSYSLSAQIKEAGACSKRYGIVRDDKEILKKKIRETLSDCDILLLTGGVSVGDYDFVKEILDELDAEFVFWRVNQRPGKPMAFLTYKDKFIFALPGNPVSVMVCFELYVRPLIKKIMGDKKLLRDTITARAFYDFKHKEGRTDFIRVKIEKVEDETYFKSTGMQGSGILMSMAEADGLAVFPEEIGNIEKNTEIQVYILKD
ncbi:MAG: molybdopterin molybdotransferase MoeA [Actinobacteria bacterium]|nr:molybdopterin molybdotransferase MoeA [Actinomycetota bacterium]